MRTGPDAASEGVHLHLRPGVLLTAVVFFPLGVWVGYWLGGPDGGGAVAGGSPVASVPAVVRPVESGVPASSSSASNVAPGGGSVVGGAVVQAESEPSFRGQPGPWGELHYVRVAIERPDELMDPDFPTSYQTSWFFEGHTPGQVAALFAGADLTEVQRQRLLETNRWQVAAGGVMVVPGHDLILGLGPEARRRLYSVLAESPTNQWHFPAFAWRGDLMAQWFEQSGLRPETLARAKQLLYMRGGSVCFSDPVALSNSLDSHREKVRLWKTLSRQATLLARLRVTAESDMDGLVRYWGRAGRAKDIRPLLESLSRVPGGASLDVAHLMSPFARRRLYTYPFPPTEARPARYNCTYTALNYFADEPDERWCEMGEARRELETEYYPLPSNDPAYGDILALYDHRDRLLHTVVYIADELVFTKNGAHFQQPWLLMDFGDMMGMYPSERPLRVVAYRRKDS